MEEEYNVPVICSSVDTVSKDELNNMLRTALYEFPVVDINVNIPKWIDIPPMENDIKMHYLEKIKEAIYKVNKLKDVDTINMIENVEDREYYGRSATEIQNIVDIRYNKQQPLIAFLYDDETMSVPALDDLVNSQTEFISNNDYVYYVAFEFCK